MRSLQLTRDGEPRTYAVIFEKGDEPMSGLEEVARAEQLSAAQLTAIGAFSSVVLGYFDRERKDYRRIELNEQVELLSLVGDIARKDDTPAVHAHVVVGLVDGTTRGGHLLEAAVWPTMEVVVTESPAHLRKELDEETGLALIRIRASRGP